MARTQRRSSAPFEYREPGTAPRRSVDLQEALTLTVDRASTRASRPLCFRANTAHRLQGLALPREAERPWATLARADEALLEAKRRYRGRVILHQAS